MTRSRFSRASDARNAGGARVRAVTEAREEASAIRGVVREAENKLDRERIGAVLAHSHYEWNGRGPDMLREWAEWLAGSPTRTLSEGRRRHLASVERALACKARGEYRPGNPRHGIPRKRIEVAVVRAFVPPAFFQDPSLLPKRPPGM